MYTEVRESNSETMPWLSDWDRADGLVSPLTSMKAMARLTDDMAAAEPGQAVFAHLLLPHFPYAFDEDCSITPMGRTWLNSFEKSVHPARNDAESRSMRYPLYLAQIKCTNLKLAGLFAALQEAGVWDNSIIILHGDHGSRLNLTNPLPENAAEMSATDYMDAFGTLLAVKLPGQSGGVNRMPVPLDDFFAKVLLAPEAPWPPLPYEPDSSVVSEPWVFLNDRKTRLEKQILPSFSDGVAH